jgi:hypothetical protein
VVGSILSWWDGVELWLSGLSFVVQTIVVMPVVLALAYGVAVLLDGALGQGIRVLQRARHEDDSRVASLLPSNDSLPDDNDSRVASSPASGRYPHLPSEDDNRR